MPYFQTCSSALGVFLNMLNILSKVFIKQGNLLFTAWFEFYFFVLLGMMICKNKFETKERIIQTKDKGDPLHISSQYTRSLLWNKKRSNSELVFH